MNSFRDVLEYLQPNLEPYVYKCYVITGPYVRTFYSNSLENITLYLKNINFLEFKLTAEDPCIKTAFDSSFTLMPESKNSLDIEHVNLINELVVDLTDLSSESTYNSKLACVETIDKYMNFEYRDIKMIKLCIFYVDKLLNILNYDIDLEDFEVSPDFTIIEEMLFSLTFTHTPELDKYVIVTDQFVPLVKSASKI